MIYDCGILLIYTVRPTYKIVPLHQITQEEQDVIDLLTAYKEAIQGYEYEERHSLRTYINENTERVRRVVKQARCWVTLTIGPPPAIGGYIMRNLDPFSAIFNRPYLQSMVPTICDMIDRTVGVIKAGDFMKEAKEPAKKDSPKNKPSSRKVFVVHGRDNASKQSCARFLEKIGLEAVILHEQTSKGMTIIEKLEHHSDVAFAIVLLTSDDVGALAGEEDRLNPRARQNVIFELGYMTAKLGRSRVCALVQDGVERPSDYDGIVYISMDWNEGWKFQVAKELRASGLEVDLNKVE